MKEALPRVDGDEKLRKLLLPYCRLEPGEVWRDPSAGHRIGVLDAAEPSQVARLMAGEKAGLAVNDPPYNLAVGARASRALFRRDLDGYIGFSRAWMGATLEALAGDAGLYVWLGADQNDGFQPLPDFMLMMRGFPELAARSFITLRNQRGYGTQKNWMAVRQELLYYARGSPYFDVRAEYTDIPKLLRGYYKLVGGRRVENLERGKSGFIRAGNVWVDVQQVFYRLEENVPGCYAQKPLKAVERIVKAGSRPGGLVLDLFAHSGTTLLACERLGRRCFTADIDPVFAEISIRRLERWRAAGRTGWQTASPFPELAL